MMDPNTTSSVIDKILQNPQNWISFLTLTFTIIIGLTGLTSVIVGLYTGKKLWDLREEHLKISVKIKNAIDDLTQKQKEYDSLRQLILQAICQPETEKSREVVDAAIESLKEKRIPDQQQNDTIISAMFRISESGDFPDLTRLLKILNLASSEKCTELQSNATKAINRFKKHLIDNR